jgi:hypothetical protein
MTITKDREEEIIKYLNNYINKKGLPEWYKSFPSEIKGEFVSTDMPDLPPGSLGYLIPKINYVIKNGL